MTKACIRKTKAEGIHNLVFGCSLEISVANINILNIIIVLLITEVFMSRMVLKIIYNGVGKLTARSHPSCQKVNNAMSAFTSALPYIHNRRGIIFTNEVHINNIANIEKHNCLIKDGTHLGEHVLFLIGKIVTALGLGIIPVFTGTSAYDYYCCITFIDGVLNNFVC